MTAPFLVTGAAGFIGSRFIQACHQNATPVIAIDHAALFQTRFQNHAINFESILDCQSFLKDLQQNTVQLPHPPCAIIHLGAITDTREKNLDLLNHFNVLYSQLLWNYAATHHIPFFYASSAATYGNGDQGFEDSEDHMEHLRPLNPYGASKLTFDLWALKQEHQGNHPPQWAGFKFFNVYGLGEHHKGFMASAIFHFLEETRQTGSIKLFKSHHPDILDGCQSRDFIHVTDIIRVLLFAAQKPITRGIYNLGTGKKRTFLDIVQGISKALAKPIDIHWVDTPLSVRSSYQYWTEAKMEKLIAQGVSTDWISLEEGIMHYIKDLRS